MGSNKKNKIRAVKTPPSWRYAYRNANKLDKLLFDILIKLNKLSMDDFYGGLDEALRQVVDFLDVDRGVLSEFFDNDSDHEVTLLQNRLGVQRIYLPELSRTVPNFSRQIKSGRITYFPPEDRINAVWGPERAYIRETGLKAHIGLPIKVSGDVVGCLIFASYRDGVIWSEEIIEKLRLLADIFGNALGRKKAHLKEQESHRLQELISSISTRFLNLQVTQVDEELNVAMKEITEYFDIDRLPLFMRENFAREEPFRLAHSWSRYEDEPEDDEEYIAFDFPYISRMVTRQGHFAFKNVDELPESAASDRQNIIRAKTKSTLAIPLIFSNNIEGVLCFETVKTEKIWTPG